MANAGKEFEKQFKESVADDMYFLRLHDSAIGFGNVEGGKFAVKSPYDCILAKVPTFYALELKSKAINRLVYKSTGTVDIKPHQIKELRKAASKGLKAGFVFNFRKENHTYFVSIAAFDYITGFQMTEKNSITEKDVLEAMQERFDVVLIPQTLKKVNYKYDLSVLFKEEA